VELEYSIQEGRFGINFSQILQKNHKGTFIRGGVRIDSESVPSEGIDPRRIARLLPEILCVPRHEYDRITQANRQWNRKVPWKVCRRLNLIGKSILP
jgi:hypothetical protein